MTEQQTPIRLVLASLKGKPAWSVVRTHGSMFYLELGKSLLRDGYKHPHGEWHFLVEMCQWRFETAESIIVGSEDDQDSIDASFKRIELGVVESIEVIPPCLDLSIVFSSGIRLKTLFTSAKMKDDWTNWTLYSPNDMSWRAHGGGQLS